MDVKSRAGKRRLAIHDTLWEMIEAHEAAQAAERERAGSVWQESGWMFTQPDGRPIDSKADRADWRAVLAEAGVREARLHDARHTMATTLALLQVAPRIAMDHMGWSNPGMMLNYQHITDAMRQDTANRVGGYLFGETEPGKPQN